MTVSKLHHNIKIVGQSMTAQAFCASEWALHPKNATTCSVQSPHFYELLWPYRTTKNEPVSGKATHDLRNQKPWKNRAAKEPQPLSGLTSDRCRPRLPVGP
jgi:hypothetical protein